MSIDNLIKGKKGTAAWYENAFALCKPDAGLEAQVNRAARKVLSGVNRYMKMQDEFGTPWFLIGAIHFKECSCDFKGVLHNGERIVGTGKKTTIVPIGKGPFATWEEAARDAIQHDGLHKIKDWSIGNMLKFAEAYNGLGYLKYHPEENSPYLWASTNINDDFGKYVSDGKYSSTAPTNKTTGLAAIIKELSIMGEINISFAGTITPPKLTVKGPFLANVQTAINNMGYQPALDIDGIPGKDTRAALMAIAETMPNK